MSTKQPLVRPVELPNRGRSLISTVPIKPGEVILTDAPLLLYPASLASLPSFCSRCFRSFQSPPVACPCCNVGMFCSVGCRDMSHARLLCVALPGLVSLGATSPDLLFLLSAYSLPTSSVMQLLSLSNPSSIEGTSVEEAQNLHAQIRALIPVNLTPENFSVDITYALLAKEKVNSFALMNPIKPESEGEESVQARAYGIYPNASLFNHDCLPNASRFDYLDDPNRLNNTDVIIRALHEIPEGREVCISYFPVNWRFKERQSRLMEDYGFRCECDRCKIESQWNESEDEGEEERTGEDEMEEGDEEMERMEEEGNGEDEDDKEFPHAYFFVRYLCERENCGGTMAPLEPSRNGVLSDLMECNLCGRVRKDEFVGGTN
ncbi:hypothetical protein LUZ60_002012 [Juncus effusus]|nr:hypothetical protein LUZ60_002012 [Juncus effusus]